MTVSVTNDKTGPLVGNGATTAFPFTFDVGSASEVIVYQDGEVVSANDYTVTVNAGGNGGTVTYDAAPTADEIFIALDPSFEQNITFVNAGKFLPEVHDEGLDRAARRAIYLRGMIARSALAPFGETMGPLESADLRAGYYYLWDEDGNPDLGISATVMTALQNTVSQHTTDIAELDAQTATLNDEMSRAILVPDGETGSIVPTNSARRNKVFLWDNAGDAGASAFSSVFDGTQTLMADHRTVMAALNGMTAGQSVMLGEPGREGSFVWSVANLATQVTADPRQGLFVAPLADATGASGAWVREAASSYNLMWWGATPGVGDTSAAVVGALATLYALRLTGYGYGDGGSRSLYAPQSPYGAYNCGSTRIDFSHQLRFYGDSTGQPGGGGTVFKWNDGVGGFKFLPGSAGVHVAGFTLVGGFAGGDESESHAIDTDVSATIRDCNIYDWGGDGIYENTIDGTGNSNGLEVSRVFIENCRNARWADGPDVNVSKDTGVSAKACRRWGVFDSAFIDKIWDSCLTHGCGVTAWNTGLAGRPCSYAHVGGHQYFAIHGQETGASTNSPSGTTASNQWWGYWKEGGVAAGIPTWFSGMVVRSGGGYLVDGVGNTSALIGCYAESDQCNQFDQLISPAHSVIAYGFLVSNGILYGDSGSIAGQMIDLPYRTIRGGRLVARDNVVTSTALVTLHNIAAATTGSRLEFATNWEADGVTPAKMGAIYSYGSADLVAGKANVVFCTRQGAAIVEAVYVDGFNENLRPETDNTWALGMAVRRWSQLYAGTATINTSDERTKAYIEAVNDILLDAWEEVDWRQFKLKDAVKRKGKDGARLHVGLIAQKVAGVLDKHGLDGFELGLLCHDTWEDEFKPVLVKKTIYEDRPDGRGKIRKVKTGTEFVPKMKDGEPVMKLARKAGDIYGIRYEEALALEAAMNRRRYERVNERLAVLEALLAV